MNKNYHLNKVYFQSPLDFDGISVSQIGRLYCNSTTVVETHLHTDLFELTIVTDGAGTVTTNGIPVRVEKGDIYFTFPCDFHKIETDPNQPLKYDFFAFHSSIDSIRKDLAQIAELYHPANMRIFKNDQIRQLIGNAISELNDEKAYSKELLTAIFRQIIIYTIRGFSQAVPAKYPDTITSSEVLCYKIMHYIDTHIYSMKNLEELSRIMDYSYGYLSATFKKTTGDTIVHYHCRRKLETARLLLLENRLKITQIAEMLNYSSAYAFSKAFKNYFGISPHSYRTNSQT